MLGLILSNIFAHLMRIEPRDKRKLKTEGQGHMYAANKSVGREDRHNAEEALAVLVDNSRVDKVMRYGVKAVVSEHNSLREACRSAGVGDGNGSVTNVLCLNGSAALSASDKCVPAHDPVLSVGDKLCTGNKLKHNLFDKRQGRARRLDDHVLLLDIRKDSSNFRIRKLDSEKNFRAGGLYHSRDALFIHSRVDCVYCSADLIKRVKHHNRLGR